MKHRAAGGLAVLLLAIGGWQFGEAVWIHAKAVLAQVLIKHAWAQTTEGERHVRPWGWADTWPVARLSVPRLGVDQIVLAGASGRTLAFGPAHMDGTAAPGGNGVAVISGHRDTHFRFLEEIRVGDTLTVTDNNGASHQFRITETHVVDSEKSGLAADTDAPRLALVTCYPFDAVEPGGPLRFLALAEPDGAFNAASATPSRYTAQRQ